METSIRMANSPPRRAMRLVSTLPPRSSSSPVTWSTMPMRSGPVTVRTKFFCMEGYPVRDGCEAERPHTLLGGPADALSRTRLRFQADILSPAGAPNPPRSLSLALLKRRRRPLPELLTADLRPPRARDLHEPLHLVVRLPRLDQLPDSGQEHLVEELAHLVGDLLVERLSGDRCLFLLLGSFLLGLERLVVFLADSQP